MFPLHSENRRSKNIEQTGNVQTHPDPEYRIHYYDSVRPSPWYVAISRVLFTYELNVTYAYVTCGICRHTLTNMHVLIEYPEMIFELKWKMIISIRYFIAKGSLSCEECLNRHRINVQFVWFLCKTFEKRNKNSAVHTSKFWFNLACITCVIYVDSPGWAEWLSTLSLIEWNFQCKFESFDFLSVGRDTEHVKCNTIIHSRFEELMAMKSFNAMGSYT